MTAPLSDEDAQRARQLIENSELADIVTHEQSSKRFDTPVEGMDENSADVEIGLQHRIAEDDFGVRLMAKVKTHLGETTASVSGEYVLQNDYKPSKRDILIFANEVAVMTLFPFLREVVGTSSAKVFGNPVILPTFERGAIGFDLE